MLQYMAPIKGPLEGLDRNHIANIINFFNHCHLKWQLLIISRNMDKRLITFVTRIRCNIMDCIVLDGTQSPANVGSRIRFFSPIIFFGTSC